MAPHRVTVKVPVTSADLGPGFDCFGMALNLYNVFALEQSGQPRMEIRGYGAARATAVRREGLAVSWKTVGVASQEARVRLKRPT